MSWIKTYFSLEDRPATAAASPICIVAYVDMGLGWRYVRQIGLSRFFKKATIHKTDFYGKIDDFPTKIAIKSPKICLILRKRTVFKPQEFSIVRSSNFYLF